MFFSEESRADLVPNWVLLFLVLPCKKKILLILSNYCPLILCQAPTGVISFNPQKAHFPVKNTEAWRIKILAQGQIVSRPREGQLTKDKRCMSQLDLKTVDCEAPENLRETEEEEWEALFLKACGPT